MEKEDSLKRYKDFIQKLHQDFKGIEIVELQNLVENISLSPSVRSGDKEKFDEKLVYYEVGLRDIDQEDVITIDEKKNRRVGDASRYLVEKYALRENDLLLPYRAMQGMKIARVGSSYPAPLVTNASVIRIKMHPDTPQDIALLIQAYLNISYVKRYILPSNMYRNTDQKKRPLLSPKELLKLPIPNFTPQQLLLENGFAQFYLQRLKIKAKLSLLEDGSKKLSHCFLKDKDNTLKYFLKENENLPALIAKESNMLHQLNKLLDDLQQLLENCHNI